MLSCFVHQGLNEYLVDQQALDGVVRIVHLFEPAFVRKLERIQLDESSSLKKMVESEAHGGCYAI